MNKFKIPKTFQLFGSDWKVKYNNDRLVDLGFQGLCEYPQSLITLYKSSNIPIDELNSTFLHELTHAILEAMNRDDLTSDENFVEIFSKLLYQYFKTAK